MVPRGKFCEYITIVQSILDMCLVKCALHTSLHTPLYSHHRWYKTGSGAHEWAVFQWNSAGVPRRQVDWCVWWHRLGCGWCSSGLCPAGFQPGSCGNMEHCQDVFKMDVWSDMHGEWVFSTRLLTSDHKLYILYSCWCRVPKLWVHAHTHTHIHVQMHSIKSKA